MRSFGKSLNGFASRMSSFVGTVAGFCFVGLAAGGVGFASVGFDGPSFGVEAGGVAGSVVGGVAAGGSNANSIDEAAKTHAKVATLTSARGEVRRDIFMGVFRFDVWFR